MTIIILLVVIYGDKLADSAKNSRQAMAAISASPPIRVTAPAFVAGREAGLSIKPLLDRNGQHYGADGDRDCQVLTIGGVPLPSLYFFVFLVGCRPISYRSLAP